MTRRKRAEEHNIYISIVVNSSCLISAQRPILCIKTSRPFKNTRKYAFLTPNLVALWLKKRAKCRPFGSDTIGKLVVDGSVKGEFHYTPGWERNKVSPIRAGVFASIECPSAWPIKFFLVEIFPRGHHPPSMTYWILPGRNYTDHGILLYSATEEYASIRQMASARQQEACGLLNLPTIELIPTWLPPQQIISIWSSTEVRWPYWWMWRWS